MKQKPVAGEVIAIVGKLLLLNRYDAPVRLHCDHTFSRRAACDCHQNPHPASVIVIVDVHIWSNCDVTVVRTQCNEQEEITR